MKELNTVELRQDPDNVTAVLSWLPPDEPNGIVTQYQVFYTGYNETQVRIVVCMTDQVTEPSDLLKCTIHCRNG